MKLRILTIACMVFLTGCKVGGGSKGNDQNTTNPAEENDTTTTPNGRVTCLLNRLGNLPADKKKVVELSAQATVACKATEADVRAFLAKRKN